MPRLHFCAVLALWLACSACATTGPDPLEPMNRSIFWFNEQADRFVLAPVAKGWDFVVPDLVQTGVANVFDNLSMPVVLLNDLLQGKPGAGFYDLLRILFNTTLGIGGIFDVASAVDIPDNDEDFGQTLAVWGVPSGPYLVLPILGPASPRHGVGMAADAFTRPLGYFIPLWASAALFSLDTINTRAIYDDEITASRESALDFYIFVRNAYRQNREHKIRDGAPDEEGAINAESDEDLYYFDEELEEE